MVRASARPMVRFAAAVALALIVVGAADTVSASTAVPTGSNALVAGAASADSADEANRDLLVIGLPSVVEYRALPLRGLIFPDPICLDFTIRDIDGGTSRMFVAVAGVREAALARRPAGDADCRPVNGAGPAGMINPSAGIEAQLRLILSGASFPTAANGAAGELIVMRGDHAPARIPFTLRRSDRSPFAQAALWFLGVAAPAAVALLGGVVLYRYQKRIDATNAQTAAFDTFRREKESELLAFFGNLYANAMDLEEAEMFTADLRRELGVQGILQALPRDQLDPLLAALSRNDRPDVARRLATAFPDHRDAIMKPLRTRTTG